MSRVRHCRSRGVMTTGTHPYPRCGRYPVLIDGHLGAPPRNQSLFALMTGLCVFWATMGSCSFSVCWAGGLVTAFLLSTVLRRHSS